MTAYIIALVCTLIVGFLLGHKGTVWVYNVMVHQGAALFTDSEGNWVGRPDLVHILNSYKEKNES